MGEPLFVALGSNMGDRAQYLDHAREGLARLPHSRVVAVSAVEETQPLGPKVQDPYLNQMVLLTTDLQPRVLLGHVQAIESQAGRVRGARWGPRTLDLDLVRYGDRSVHEPDLIIPHPEIARRPFWIREMAELFPASLDPTADPQLPEWAQVSRSRRAHVDRVVGLLGAWAVAMGRLPEERRRWLAAGFLHDALRDAPADLLSELAGDDDLPPPLRHGPAAAVLAARRGETDDEILDAVRHHSTGHPSWGELGKVLYLADYLEPGRPFRQMERADLAAAVPTDLPRVLRIIVSERCAWVAEQGFPLPPATVDFRDQVLCEHSG